MSTCTAEVQVHKSNFKIILHYSLNNISEMNFLLHKYNFVII